MLSLFMMLGVAYVVMASRARDASRGFAKVVAPVGYSQLPVNQLLESAAMLVIRGTAAGSLASPSALLGGSAVSFESLLDDQYGTVGTLTGTVNSFQDFSPLCSVTVIGISGSSIPTSCVQLSGRVLTLLPSAGKASSHRILRSTGTAPGPYTFWIANVGNAFSKRRTEAGATPAAGSSYNFPPAGTKIVINGCEHSGTGSSANEAWDGHDFARNPFLAQVEPMPANPSSATVVRASMINTSGTAIANANDVDGDLVPDQCDNDNDGIVDGQFFHPGFPTTTAANGNTIVTHMSCLIVDLDGRLNVNAHGSIAASLYPSTHSGWPATPPGAWTGIPMGSGYGPADITGTGALAAFNAIRPSPGTDTPWASLSLGASGSMQYSSSGDGASQGRSSLTPDPGCRLLPLALPALEGRYAGRSQAVAPAANTTISALATSSGALPGVSGSNDLMSTYNEMKFSGVRSPIDLQGRMKTRAIAPTGLARVPTLSFAKPDSSPEFIDDPYEVNLNQQKSGGILADPRTMGQAVGSAPDNIFSIAELERVIRPYDADSATLPPRLFALLGSQAEVCRYAVTTESWDTPVVTGTAAVTLFGTSGWFSSVTGSLYSTNGPSVVTSSTIPNGVVPPDLAAGLRLDVTRSGTTDLQRRSLFKDIYLTCVAMLTGSGNNPSAATAAQYAQWAANVVEYQDADSTMTRYEYDLQPLDGWDVDGDPSTTTSEPTRAVVWGAERPEAVITQTLAWDDGGSNGELYVMLHRPWSSRLEVPGSPATAAEPSDPELRSTPTASGSSIALSGTAPGGAPIWQLRIGTGASSPLVRFDALPTGSVDLGATVAPASPPPFISAFDADSWLCIRPSAPSSEGVTVPAGVQTLSITNGTLKAPIGTTAVRLERLADPAAAYNATSNPYLIVDAADVTVVLRTPVTPLPHQVLTRDRGWNQHFSPASYATAPPLSASWGGSPAWMMWPNRPLTSIVELMHVPGFAANSFVPQSAASATSPDRGMLANYAPPLGVTYLPDPLLLEAVRVPSRFAGTRLTIQNIPANASFLTNLERIGLYAPVVSVNQLDLAREPGRVNMNTISNDAVWNDVVVGGTHTGSTVPLRPAANLAAVQPLTGSLMPANPAETLLNILSITSGGAATAPFAETTTDIPDADINPHHRMRTATRLANTATNRSHLFAVWITLRTMEQTPPPNPVSDPDTVRYHRMFFIYDRSKPVAFEAGKDHNVRDGILLERVLQ
jgi:hypothetical protein